MTRRWRDNQSLVQQVRLFFIDEVINYIDTEEYTAMSVTCYHINKVHQLNDETRGPTVEAIVSRMKTVRGSLQQREGATGQKQIASIPLRFIAVSATIPNFNDVKCFKVVDSGTFFSLVF